MAERDRIYETAISEPGDFVFDDRVVKVFPDMINRSVPGYATIVAMTAMLARRYALPGSTLYDLGCSLGAVALAMQGAVTTPHTRILAVDNSPGMIRRLDEILAGRGVAGGPPVETLQQDILDTEIANASVVVLNFTLQFIDPAQRPVLLQRIADGLAPGGILVLSEKICFTDAAEQDLQTEWHHDFKRAQGYSELEIARKRDALENVMKPESLEQHRERLERSGFGHVYRWHQGFNFVSMVAFR